jgi:hypothetical protein
MFSAQKYDKYSKMYSKMSDVKSPCEKALSFGGYGKPAQPKTDSPGNNPGTAPAPALNLLPSEETLKGLGSGLSNDIVTISNRSKNNAHEPSTIEKAYRAVKDCPVKPLFGSIKGVKFSFKI